MEVILAMMLPVLSLAQALRTEFERPSSSMRLRTATAITTSVARASAR